MHRLLPPSTLALLVVAGCTQGTTSPASATTSTATPVVTLAPTVGPTLAPTEDPNAARAAAARTFAIAAGFNLSAADTPQVRRHEAGYEPTVLWEVSLALSMDVAGAALRVYLDDGGRVRVVESDLGFPEPSGNVVTRAQALQLATAALELVGLDADPGHLQIGPSIPGRQWNILLNRTVAGYPVANPWASTGIAGDRTWVTLRGDGGLVELYAIQPPAAPTPTQIMTSAELDERLASAAGLSVKALRALEPRLTWIRALDNVGAEARVLTLAYCALRVEHSGWEAWCIDAGTGVRNLHQSAAD